MLADMHLRNVRQKLMLKKRTEEAVQRLQVMVVVYIHVDVLSTYLDQAKIFSL